MSRSALELSFEKDRVAALLDLLELMAGGSTEKRLPISPLHDDLDAIAFGVNVLVGELQWTSARLLEAEQHRALRESEERFRLIVDTAPVMLWTNGPDKLCDFVSRPWLEFTGRTKEQELGTGWTKGVHPEDLDFCWRTYVAAFDARQQFRMEYRFRRADGGYRWTLVTGVPRYGPDGSFTGYVGSCIDITDRREMEDALRESQQRYRLATAAGAVGVWDWNLETDDLHVDPELKLLLGFEDADIPNRNDAWISRVHPEDAAAMRAQAQACFSDGKNNVHAELRMLHKDGSHRWFLTRGSVLRRADGTPYRMVGTQTNITERKRAEEASREHEAALQESQQEILVQRRHRDVAEGQVHTTRNELTHLTRVSLMGELSASLAHELNQPLTAILANTQAAERFLQSPEPDLENIREILADIASDARRAGEVIRRLRELLKKGEPRFQTVQIAETVDSVLRLASNDLVSRDVTVTTQLPATLPAVSGDLVQLQQVILNLVINAADAMRTVAHPDRRITIDGRRGANATIEVTVSDRGHGIADDQLAKVFEPFFTTKDEGLGVGLSISRTIVESHGGRLWASNNPAGGATLHLVLPTV